MMKKLLLTLLITIGVGLPMMAGQPRLDRSNIRLSSERCNGSGITIAQFLREHQALLANNQTPVNTLVPSDSPLLGDHILCMSAYDPEDGSDIPCEPRIIRVASTNNQANSGHLQLQNFYNAWKVQLEPNQTLTAAVVSRNWVYKKSRMARRGDWIYDTTRTVYVMPESALFENYEEDEIPPIHATLFEDGSICFDDAFLFVTQVVASRTKFDFGGGDDFNSVGAVSSSSDTTWHYSRVFYDVCLMPVNGVHKYQRVRRGYVYTNGTTLDTQSLDPWGNNMVVRSSRPTGGDTPSDGEEPSDGETDVNTFNPVSGFDSMGHAELPGSSTGYAGKEPRRPISKPGRPLSTDPIVIAHDDLPVDYEQPVYLLQEGSTVYVINLYGNGFMMNNLNILSNGYMSMPQQVVDHSESGADLYIYSTTSQFARVWDGITGQVTPEAITWGITLNYNTTQPSYYYKNNQLMFTNGQEFFIGESLSASPVDDMIDKVLNSSQGSISDVVKRIDEMLAPGR